MEKQTGSKEGRRGSEEAVPGPSVFPSGEPGMSGDFWGSIHLPANSNVDGRILNFLQKPLLKLTH